MGAVPPPEPPPGPPDDKTPYILFAWLLVCFIAGLVLLGLTAFFL